MKYKYDEFNNNEFESHRLAVDSIESGSKILDLGCATGYFAKELSKRNCETWGVDYDPIALRKASRYCKQVFLLNIDEIKSLPLRKKFFDYVVITDVLEHLLHPENILRIAKVHLKNGGKIVVSVPNIAHASIRWMLLRGDFKYTSTGIMDKTHVHFYTTNSFQEMLNTAGYEIVKLSPTNGMCKVPLLYKITDRLPASWQYWIACKIPTLFAYQFIVIAKVQ